MKRKNRNERLKNNKNIGKAKRKNIFLLWVIFSPIVVFSIAFLIRVINGGDASIKAYTDNFIFLFDEIKLFEKYVFACAASTLIGILTVSFNKFRNKRLKPGMWIFLFSLILFIMLISSRLVFLIAHRAIDENFLGFIFNGINLYSFTFSLMLTFAICGVIKYFDDVFLKK